MTTSYKEDDTTTEKSLTVGLQGMYTTYWCRCGFRMRVNEPDDNNFLLYCSKCGKSYRMKKDHRIEIEAIEVTQGAIR